MTPGPTETGPPPAGPTPARAEYARRLDDRRAAFALREARDRRLSDLRLALFLAGAALLAAAFGFGAVGWAWSLLPIAGFLAVLPVHARVRKAARHAGRAVAYYENGLKRVDGTWPGSGVAGDRFLDPEHPYAADLDLFGAGSLFERLCTARTQAGEETLAAWLLGPADPATVRDRQLAVDELRPRLDLREQIHLLGSDVREGIDPEALAAWGRSPAVFPGPRVPAAAAILAVLGTAALVAWGFAEEGRLFFLVVAIAELAFASFQKARVRAVVAPVERRAHDLVVLAGLLARVEQGDFRSPALVRLKEALSTGGGPASARIARLPRLVQWLESRDNQAFAPVAALWLWGTQFSAAIDRWRARHGPEIGGWLATVGEFEALCALASYAYENPGDPFPAVVGGGARFDGRDLGHPLIPAARRVRNDVRLGGELRVLLVSGSNMSGKSTLLRTVGVNAVLALAGAPVCAEGLTVSVLAVGATLRIQDSLQAGKSRFYAELTRIREIVGLTSGPRPLLFLLDEVFHGTNSHDRTVGAGAVVRGLIDRGAVGLVTTHDLALAEFADRLAPRAANVHFEDQLVDGTMRFDYRMRPGVVTHSNALALMRAVGLDV